MKGIVYVTSEDPRFDYSPALQWGERIVGVFPPGQVHLHPQIALYRARGILKHLAKDDYLALVGDPIKIGLCVAVAAERLGTVRLLKFNRQSLSYIPIEVNFLARDASLLEHLKSERNK